MIVVPPARNPEELGTVIPHAGICEVGVGQPMSLPQSPTKPCAFDVSRMIAFRSFVHLVTFLVALSITFAESEPTAENLADWSELDVPEFKAWKISKYDGYNYPFNGGSKILFFQTSTGLSFQIMAAHPDHWTPEDRIAKRQVFYIVHKDRYYFIEPASDQEEQLRGKLLDAQTRLKRTKKGDPRDLGAIAHFVKTRKQMFPLGEDGADQPATAAESKTEGEEKPKPESEVRSQ